MVVMRLDRALSPLLELHLKTGLTPEDVYSRLAGCVTVAAGADTGVFDGELTPERFVLVPRQTGWRRWFAPRLVGEVAFVPWGSAVTVEVRLGTPFAAFLTAWMILALWVFARGAAVVAEGNLQGLLPMAFPFVSTFVIVMAFRPESDRAERLLRDLLPPPSESAVHAAAVYAELVSVPSKPPR